MPAAGPLIKSAVKQSVQSRVRGPQRQGVGQAGPVATAATTMFAGHMQQRAAAQGKASWWSNPQNTQAVARTLSAQRQQWGSQRGINNKGTSWWNAPANDPRQDWRQIPDLSVQRGSTLPWRIPLGGTPKGTDESATTVRQPTNGTATAQAETPAPAQAETPAAVGSGMDVTRNRSFLFNASTRPGQDFASGEIGNAMNAIGQRGHTLNNVRTLEDEMTEMPLSRSSSFALGQGPLALMPGQQPKQRRPAGANPAAMNRLRADWPTI